MQCPPEIAEIVWRDLRRLLTVGSSRIETMAFEADHLHNLTEFPAATTGQSLSFLLHIERVDFVDRSEREDVQVFEPLWQALAEHVTPLKK